MEMTPSALASSYVQLGSGRSGDGEEGEETAEGGNGGGLGLRWSGRRTEEEVPEEEEHTEAEDSKEAAAGTCRCAKRERVAGERRRKEKQRQTGKGDERINGQRVAGVPAVPTLPSRSEPIRAERMSTDVCFDSEPEEPYEYYVRDEVGPSRPPEKKRRIGPKWASKEGYDRFKN